MATKEIQLESSWLDLLSDVFETQEMLLLRSFLREEKRRGKVIYPSGENIFAAFHACPVARVKVVILGQDPYHGPRQAHGLAFSVPDEEPLPPSLQNIYKELQDDVPKAIASKRSSGNLNCWAQQGVLLLNSVLTVEHGKAGSHQGKGWEFFTDQVILRLAARQQGLVFILWGAYARKKAAQIPNTQHLLLKSAHPSPLSAHRGFFGSRPFSQCNEYLQRQGKEPICW